MTRVGVVPPARGALTPLQMANALQHAKRDPYADVGAAYAEETDSRRAFNLPTGDRRIVRTVETGTNETVVRKVSDAAAEV